MAARHLRLINAQHPNGEPVADQPLKIIASPG
jgi:hypothetical protein